MESLRGSLAQRFGPLGLGSSVDEVLIIRALDTHAALIPRAEKRAEHTEGRFALDGTNLRHGLCMPMPCFFSFGAFCKVCRITWLPRTSIPGKHVHDTKNDWTILDTFSQLNRIAVTKAICLSEDNKQAQSSARELEAKGGGES